MLCDLRDLIPVSVTSDILTGRTRCRLPFVQLNSLPCRLLCLNFLHLLVTLFALLWQVLVPGTVQSQHSPLQDNWSIGKPGNCL